MAPRATSIAENALFVGAVGAAVALNILSQVASTGKAPDSDSFGWHAVDAATGITFAVCGAIARRLKVGRRISWLMVAGGMTWAFGTFSFGLVSQVSWWAPFVAMQSVLILVITVLALSYPNGRVSSPLARALIAITAVLLVSDIVTHLFFFDPLSSCGCLPNSLAVVSDPQLSQAIVRYPEQWGLAQRIALTLAVIYRWVRATRPWRAINLLMTIAIVVYAATQAYLNVGNDLEFPDLGMGPFYLADLATAAVPVIYVVGLYALGQTRARVADVILAAREGIDRPAWDRLIKEALDDREAGILWASEVSGEFVDAAGTTRAPPPDAETVMSGGAVIALLIYDPATGAKRDLLKSLAESLRLMTENDRLTSELERSLAQVRESRQRLVGAADNARRRIERDLHDGAQQLLLTAALSVEHASRRARRSSDVELTAMLNAATDQLFLARRELRELARGITPAVLDHGGLDAALEELALRCSIAVTVRVSGEGRPSELAETTVYFAVSECLTNIAKYSGANTAAVEVLLGDPVELTVTDDGIGGAAITRHGGLAGLVDRVEAVGGQLTVSSPLGQGTAIRAIVPSSEREPA